VPTGAHTPRDLVVAAHTLSELPRPEDRDRLVAQLWGQTERALVLVELGNAAGFAAMLRARALLGELAAAPSAEAAVLAPCPHMLACPKADAVAPCHVPARLQVPPSQHLSGHSFRAGFATEKFCYLVVARRSALPAEQPAPAWPRIVANPMQRRQHLVFNVCTPEVR
jgi:ribosomal protein RSM22 (predicted rRNA methylase)